MENFLSDWEDIIVMYQAHIIKDLAILKEMIVVYGFIETFF